MNSSTYYPKIQKIADTYGYDSQSRQCIEEMAELTQAINKMWRAKNNAVNAKISTEIMRYDAIFQNKKKNLIEEIADVQIMLWQIAYLLNTDVTPIIEQKLDRQLERIEKCTNS